LDDAKKATCAVWLFWVMNVNRKVVLSIIGAALLLAVATPLMRPAPKPKVFLPDLELKTVQGKAINVKGFEGQPLVLNTWATWCTPCKKELPLMLEAAKKNPQIRFVFVNQGEGPEAIKAFEKETGLKLPEPLLDVDTRLAEALGIQGLPTTFFFAQEGGLRDKKLGELREGELEKYLGRLK
jgi:thiol-disulfide isomerase/thioredoxin